MFCYSGIFAAKVDWEKVEKEVKLKTPVRMYHLEDDEYAVYTKGYAKVSYDQLKKGGLDHFTFEVNDKHRHTMDKCCEALEKFC